MLARLIILSFLLLSNIFGVSCKKNGKGGDETKGGEEITSPDLSFDENNNILSNKKMLENKDELETLLLFLDKYANGLKTALPAEEYEQIRPQVDDLKAKISRLLPQVPIEESEKQAYESAVDALVKAANGKLNAAKIEATAAEKLRSDWQQEYSAFDTKIKESYEAASRLREEAEKDCDKNPESCLSLAQRISDLIKDAQEKEKTDSAIGATVAAAKVKDDIKFAQEKTENLQKEAKAQQVKIAHEKAISTEGIIEQINGNNSPSNIAKNLDGFFEKNYNKDDVGKIVDSIIDHGNAIKDLKEIYRDLKTEKNKGHLLEAMESKLSDFRIAAVTAQPIQFDYAEIKNLEPIVYVGGAGNYDKASLGELLKNRRILNQGKTDQESLQKFNDELRKKYDQFKAQVKVAGKTDAFNKERFFYLLQNENEFNKQAFAQQLVRLPASVNSREILAEYLSNIENPKSDIVQKSLLSSLLFDRKFNIHEREDREVKEDQKERLNMIKMLLDKGGIGALKSSDDVDNFVKLAEGNKDLKDLLISKINAGNKDELEQLLLALCKKGPSKDLREILSATLKTEKLSDEKKQKALLELLRASDVAKDPSANAIILDLVSAGAFHGGLALGDAKKVISYLMAISGNSRLEFSSQLALPENKNSLNSILAILTTFDQSQNLNSNIKLASELVPAIIDLATKNKLLSNLLHSDWRGEKEKYNDKMFFDLINKLIELGGELPAAVSEDEAKNILEHFKNNEAILQRLLLSPRILSAFLKANEAPESNEAYNALKKDILSGQLKGDMSKVVGEITQAKSIAPDKRASLIDLLLDKGANLQNVPIDRLAETLDSLKPERRLAALQGLASASYNTKNAVLGWAVNKLSNTDLATIARALLKNDKETKKAFVKLLISKGKDKLVEIINRTPDFGLGLEDLRNIIYTANNGMTLPLLWTYMQDANANDVNTLATLLEPVAAAIKHVLNITDDAWRSYLLKEYSTVSPNSGKYENKLNIVEIFKAKQEKYNFGDKAFRLAIMKALHAIKSDFDNDDKIKLKEYLENSSDDEFIWSSFMFFDDSAIKKMIEYIKAQNLMQKFQSSELYKMIES